MPSGEQAGSGSGRQVNPWQVRPSQQSKGLLPEHTPPVVEQPKQVLAILSVWKLQQANPFVSGSSKASRPRQVGLEV